MRKKRMLWTMAAVAMLVVNGCERTMPRTLPTEGKSEIPLTLTLLEEQNAITAQITQELTGGTLENPKILVNPYGISPLSALMQLSTETPEALSVTVRGKTPQADLTMHYPASTEHLILIVGLLADQPTEVQIRTETQTTELQLQADALPQGALEAEVTIEHQDSQPNRLYFTTPSSSGYASAYDVNGDLRWILSEMLLWDLNLLDNGLITLSSERLLDSPYYTTGFLTMDLSGHIALEYSVEGGYHHDLDQLPNGNFLIASNDLSGDTVEDVVVEVDAASGEVLRHIDLKVILPMEDGKSLNWTAEDWFHNNSVDYNSVQNTLTVSGRHQDVVAVIDYDSLKLRYLVGSPEGWSEAMQPFFLTPQGEPFEWQWAQHAATWISDNQLMLFDNGMYRSKNEDQALSADQNYSRMVIYEIDEANKTIRQVMEYGKQRGSAYYSPYICDADQLAEDRWLVTSGGISWLDGQINNMPGSLTEYDRMEAYITELNGTQPVFELRLPANIYRSEQIDLTQTTMTPLSEASRRGSLGVTRALSEKELSSTLDFSAAQPLPDQLADQLSLIRQSDRLQVTVTLNKHDNFDVLLVSEEEVRGYPVQTDTHPGMCVAVFNQPQTPDVSTLSQTISLENLEGVWHLYYLMNGKLLDPQQILTLE